MISTQIDIFLSFLKLGCTSFGGPIAHLAYFRSTFVEQKAWLSEHEYAQLVAVCQTLPGPASSQVGFSIGLYKGGLVGAILAFIAFTLPSVLLLVFFANYLDLFASELGFNILQGLAILAFVVVLQGVLGMARQLCTTHLSFGIALFVFVLLVLFQSALMQVVVIFLGALFAFMFSSESFDKHNTTAVRKKDNASKNKYLSLTTASFSAGLFVILLLALPFLSPLFFAPAAGFYQTGSLVFGGGHVVLPLLEQLAVTPEWLNQERFLAGYGATQAVPGPMFSFAGYLGFLLPNAEPSVLSGLSNAMWAIVFIFLPGFLLLLAVLPIWQHIMNKTSFKKAILGANAAVVGLLAATLYDPIFIHGVSSAQDIVIAAVGFAMLHRFKIPVLLVVLFCVCARVLFGLIL